MKDTAQLQIFKDFDGYSPKYHFFKNSLFGQIHDSLPWEELAALLPKENTGPGAPKWFDAKGMFALMFLKAYLNVSDRQLIERFNTDYSLQMFCGKLLAEDKQIRDTTILTRVRKYIEEHCEWERIQEVLLDCWKRDVDNSHVLLMDATCYESYIRFPTDVKLLWESCHWVFEKQLYRLCKVFRIKRPRSKYTDQKRKQLAYSRKRKKTYRETKARRKSLVHLLGKGLGQLQEVLDMYRAECMGPEDFSYLRTIKKVLVQQTFLLDHRPEELKDRIVSLHKPYVRPIKRGKENKPVEFGMKAHVLQVDGLSFLDTMSFNNFNETTRLKLSVLKHRRIFGKTSQLGADRIYASNANRRYCTENGIFTCFPKKGPKKHPKPEQILSAEISRQRATVMEGVFGTQKDFYGLRKIRVKGEKREKLMVLFAAMAANAVKIAKRRTADPPPERQAA
jgi:IS5 family transposase